MAHRIDAEQGQEGGQATVVSQPPGTVAPASSARPAVQPVALHPVQEKPQVGRKPIWDKNNVGFWLAVCIAISLAFSVLYHAIG